MDKISCDAKHIAPVSVIIPCYCCADTIGRAVASILSQTMLPAEIWLIDDASPDGDKTLEILKTVCDQFKDICHIEVIALAENGGPSVARNAGWDRATQPFLAFLDADDAWHPRKLEIQHGWMERNPLVVLTGHSVRHVKNIQNEDLTVLPELSDTYNAVQVTSRSLLFANCLPTRSVMLHREIPYRFDQTKRRSEDYLLWLTIVFDGNPTWRLEPALALTFKAPYGESGLTADLWGMEKGELDTYKRIYQEGYINRFIWKALSLYSILKYGRRWVISRLAGR